MVKNKLILNSLYIMLVLFSIFTVSATQYYNDYSDVLLICNSDSEISNQICGYFISQRISQSFDTDNVLNLTGIVTDELINDTQYESILSQIETWITENPTKEINYIITTKGVPLKNGKEYNCHYTPTWSTDTVVNCRAIDSKLMSDLGATNNYFGKEDTFTNEKYGGYLITRLDGYEYNDIKSLIDRATLGSDSYINGKFVLNNYATNFLYFSHALVRANTTLTDANYDVYYNDDFFVMNYNNISGYVSWGSNAGTTASTNSSAWNLSFNNGALAETFVSSSARTMNLYPWRSTSAYGDFSFQSLITDLIKQGVTGVKGYVYEPYVSALAQSDILFDRHTKGYNLADSYFMASSERNWMDVIIGDPKTHILSNNLAPTFSLNSHLDGERINQGTILNFTFNINQFTNIDKRWYEHNGVNITLESNLINTSNWDLGINNITIYANESEGCETGSKDYYFIINTTIGTTPIYSIFNGPNTTDIKTLEDKTAVEDLILEIENVGSIKFLETVNISGLDLNTNINLIDRTLKLNSTAIPNLNKSAEISFYNYPSSMFLNPYIIRNGQRCDDLTLPACYNLTPLDSEIVTFNVTEFSEYSIIGNDITECVEIPYPGVYNLVNNLSSNNTCLNITADDVTINGNGNSISFGLGTPLANNEYAIIAYNINNLNINNLLINATFSSNQYATSIENISNLNINNINITDVYYGMRFKNITGLIDNIFINHSNQNSFMLYGLFNVNLNNITIYNQTGGQAGFMVSEESNNISFNNINITKMGSGSGFYLVSTNVYINNAILTDISSASGIETYRENLTVNNVSFYNNNFGIKSGNNLVKNIIMNDIYCNGGTVCLYLNDGYGHIANNINMNGSNYNIVLGCTDSKFYNVNANNTNTGTFYSFGWKANNSIIYNNSYGKLEINNINTNILGDIIFGKDVIINSSHLYVNTTKITGINRTVNFSSGVGNLLMLFENYSNAGENNIISGNNGLETINLSKSSTFKYFTDAGNLNIINNKPLYLSSDTITLKNISLNVTDDLYIDVNLSIDNCRISNIEYTPYNKSSYIITPTNYSCINNLLLLNSLDIIGNDTNNILMITFDYSTPNSNGIEGVKTQAFIAFSIISLIAIISAVLLIINMFNGGIDQASLIAITIGIILIGIVIFIGFIIIDNVATVITIV